MLILSLFFYIALATLLRFLLVKPKLNHHHRFLPPGPPTLPLIGNLHQLIKSGQVPHLLLWHLSKLYGPLMSLRLGGSQTVVVSSAEMAKKIMSTHESVFRDRPSLLGQYKMSYNGLDLAFSQHDEYNKEMKKTCVIHLLNVKKVKSYRPIREEEVSRTIQKIIKSCADHDMVINLTETVMGLMSTVICRSAFGKSYEEEGGDGTRFCDLINEAEAILESFCIYDYFPFMSWVDRLIGTTSKIERTFNECDKLYQQVIYDHIDDLKRVQLKQEDIVDVLLNMHKDRSFSSDVTWDHIKAILMDIFVGGTYPSASILICAMRELAKDDRVMKKVQQEIRSMFGGEMSFVNEDHLQGFPYLKAVVKETMRLHPPIPLIPRESTKECTINGYVIEPKTQVFVNAWAIGRDNEVWENSGEFCPERFLTSTTDFKGQHFEFIPFGSGRRSCPGMHMGVVTIELTLANLLYNFNWKLPKSIEREDINNNSLCLVSEKWARV